MSGRLARFALPVVVLVVLAALVALFAGSKYAIVTLLIGVVIIGGLASGLVVAQADDAPFATDDSTPAGDSAEHSEVSSAR